MEYPVERHNWLIGLTFPVRNEASIYRQMISKPIIKVQMDRFLPHEQLS